MIQQLQKWLRLFAINAKSAIIVFDELNTDKYPGETKAKEF